VHATRHISSDCDSEFDLDRIINRGRIIRAGQGIGQLSAKANHALDANIQGGSDEPANIDEMS
jgi:hypothetical protein